jgi:hypothetical protein
MLSIYRVSIPEFLVSLGRLQKTPEQHSSQNDHINIPFIDHQTILDLTQG